MYNINMTDIPYQHSPVMPEEVAGWLAPSAGKTIVDCTLGGGGHAERILKAGARVIAFDQDEEAVAAAKQRLAGSKDIEYINDNFSKIGEHIKNKVDGFLFDLGVSSYQIDAPVRGFSLQSDGPLDMRMDRRQKRTAEDIINLAGEDELCKIIKEYGEERFARRIASSIARQRPVSTTFQLKEIVEKAIPTWKKRESVTRVFQALRIAVNRELERLKAALLAAIGLLKPGGRMVVLSYHSLEDRIVKQAFRQAAQDGILKIMTKKPQLAAEAETAANPRARSAKLRAAEKL